MGEMTVNTFPIDLSGYVPLSWKTDMRGLPDPDQFLRNVHLVRDTIIFITALAQAKGVGGHTGGAYDIVPEYLMLDALRRGEPDLLHPEFFEAAGHRAAIHYTMAALNGRFPLEELLKYREHRGRLYGHPERDDSRGLPSSTGRLGHEWGQVNGVAERLRTTQDTSTRRVILFESDGSFQEGTDTEAARYAVAHKLPVIALFDANDVTIEGHPSEYLPGFNLERMLDGIGATVMRAKGEEYNNLWKTICRAVQAPAEAAEDGPTAIINKRLMMPGVPGIEGTTKGHDAIPVDTAVKYLKNLGHDEAVRMLKETAPAKKSVMYLGSGTSGKNRVTFGDAVVDILSHRTEEDRKKVLVVSNDLGGSCGLEQIGKAFPEIYRRAGITERHNFLLAAGFGREPGYQGIYGTFSAFLEMVVSEITMAGMNKANVLAHFSHAGVDDMADDRCHFGTNIFFADNAHPEEDGRRLYFPADHHQMRAIVAEIFDQPGLRFVFSTRSATPEILQVDGRPCFAAEKGYRFVPCKDEIIRDGQDGYVVSYGEMLYRCLDVVEKLRGEGVDVGLINKPTLNVVDKQMMEYLSDADTRFVLVVETQNWKNGLGSRFGTHLLEWAGRPVYDHMGAVRGGAGGLGEQVGHQGLSQTNIYDRIRELHAIAGWR